MLKPLPKDVEADSKCAYCGVSYLIMHEIEAYKSYIQDLEQKIKKLEIRQTNSSALEKNSTQSIEQLALINQQLNQQLKELAEYGTKYRGDISQLERRTLALDRITYRLGALAKDEIGNIRRICGYVVAPRFDSTGEKQIVYAISAFYTLKENQLERMRASYAACFDELAAAQRLAAELQHGEKISAARIDALVSEIQQYKQENTARSAELAQTTVRLRDAVGDLNNCKIQIYQLSAEHLALKSAYSEAEQNVTRLQNENNALTSKYLGYLREAERLAKLNEQTQERFSEFKKSRAAEADIHREEEARKLTALQSQIDRLYQQVGALLDEKTAFEADEQKQKANLQQYAVETGRKYQYIQQLEARVLKQTAVAARLADEIHDLRARLLEQTAADAQLARDRQSAAEEHRKVYYEAESAFLRLTDAQTERDKLATRVLELQRYLEGERDQLQRKQGAIDELQARIGALHPEACDFACEVQICSTDGRADALAEENRLLTEKIAALQQTVFNECRERNDLMRTLNALRTQMAQSPARAGSGVK